MGVTVVVGVAMVIEHGARDREGAVQKVGVIARQYGDHHGMVTGRRQGLEHIGIADRVVPMSAWNLAGALRLPVSTSTVALSTGSLVAKRLIRMDNSPPCSRPTNSKASERASKLGTGPLLAPA